MRIRKHIVYRDNEQIRLYCSETGQPILGRNIDGRTDVHLITKDDLGILFAGSMVAYIIKVIERDGRYYFMDICSKKYFCVRPDKLDVTGNFAANREIASAWEAFDMKRAAIGKHKYDFYFNFITKPDPKAYAAKIAAGAGRIPFDETFFSYLVEMVGAERLSSHLPPVEFLKTKLVRFPWTKELLSFRDRDPSLPLSIGREKDWLSRPARYPNADILLNAALRARLPNKGKSCVVATARNEGVYLVEWIAYQRLLGFDKIFMYTNNNTDGSTELLRSLRDEGYIELIESDVDYGVDAQGKAYNHALRINSDALGYTWCAFIDTDEFVVIDGAKFREINDFLTWHEARGANVIALSWILAANKLFSENWMTEPLTSRIRRTSPFQTALIKCICKPQQMHSSGPHYPTAANGLHPLIANADREKHIHARGSNVDEITVPARPTYNNAFLYHFEMRSFPELLWKYSRNRGSFHADRRDIYINDQFLDRIHHFQRCMEGPKSGQIQLTFSTEQISAEINRILSNPVIEPRYRDVVDLTAERQRALMAYLPEFIETKIAEGISGAELAAAKWVIAHVIEPSRGSKPLAESVEA